MRLREPRVALAALVVLQWVCVAIYAATVDHNGWLWYQGGDETFYYTSAWLLNDGEVARTGISYLWPYALAPIVLPFGPSLLDALPAIVLFNVVVLLPLGLLSVYGLAARIAGRTLGLAAAAVWVLLPHLAIPLWVARYHERYTEQVMPQFLGLTAMADFPSMIAVLLAAYCCFRALDEHDHRWAALGGLAAGLAVAVKPANALFLAAPAIVFLAWPAARRLSPAFAVAVLPGLLGLAAWKLRSLGALPVSAAADDRLAVFALLGPLERYGGIDLDRLGNNLDALREFFWTVRVLEWAALAGVVAVARRSGAKAVFLAVWLMAFLLVKGGAPQASVDTGSFFRLLMPAFPAFFILAASLPLLVPTLGSRFVPFAAGAFDGRWTRVGIVAATVAVAQLVTIPFLAEASPGRVAEDSVARVMAPIDHSLEPRATLTEAGVKIVWPARSSGRTKAFYRILRERPSRLDEGSPGSPPIVDGVRCVTAIRGAPVCELLMTLLGVSRDRVWVDSAPSGEWTYRIAIAANWANDPLLGDMVLLSGPVRITVP